jgi:diguanylate cyclase (GGDEF)-like protein
MEIVKHTLLISTIWFLLICASFFWNFDQAQKEQQKIALHTARNLVGFFNFTSQWNDFPGGFYVPISTKTTPASPQNPLSEEIKVNKSLTLTKINSVCLIRQLPEITSTQTGPRLHISSLQTILPESKATEQEQLFLKEFAAGVKKEASSVIKDKDATSFFYMAPLKAETSCLQCHNKQGYKEGDILGGISVTQPFVNVTPSGMLLLTHIGIAIAGLLGIYVSSRSLHKAYDNIQQQAVFDNLTDIPNRQGFSQRISKEFQRSNRTQKPLSIIICDIDHFKAYNDTYGHGSGDKCLRKIAQTIKKTLVRPGDFCARYGGEEFVVALTDTSHQGAMHVAEIIRLNTIELQIAHKKSPPLNVVTLSLGVATSTDQPMVTYEELINNADAALYRAKRTGRNRVESSIGMTPNPVT